MTTWVIREERPGDEAAIRGVTEAAFTNHPHSEGTETAILDALRADGDLALSLVAEADGAIVGHVAFSPVTLSSDERGWLALGPISVLPDRQGGGIGRALIEAGIARMRDTGAAGIVLVGDRGLYARFGFVRDAALHVEGPLAPYFQVLGLTGTIPQSSVSFAPAFELDRIRSR